MTPAAPALAPAPRPWGRAARRQLADAIARELAETGHLDQAGYEAEQDRDRPGTGGAVVLPIPPRDVDRRQPLAPGDPAQAAAARAISAARTLAATIRPPRGSAAARPAGQGSARVITATGDRWSIVARDPEGPAVLLLDDLPAGVTDLASMPALAELASALADAADRAARG